MSPCARSKVSNGVTRADWLLRSPNSCRRRKFMVALMLAPYSTRLAPYSVANMVCRSAASAGEAVVGGRQRRR